MQRLLTRPQFQATMSGGTIARTPHFVLHRLVLNKALVDMAPEPKESGATLPASSSPQALFLVSGCQKTAVWMGPVVPKRWAKRSVTRHAIKRQIYAVAGEFDSQLHALPPAAYVVRLRAGFDRKQFVSATSTALKSAVRAELLQLFTYATRPSTRKPSASVDMVKRQAVAVEGEAAP